VKRPDAPTTPVPGLGWMTAPGTIEVTRVSVRPATDRLKPTGLSGAGLREIQK
jgi:hypothetical protein